MESITVTIKIDPVLKRTKKKGFSVYVNGSRVGDIYLGDVLQFPVTETTNLIQLSWTDKKPFNWPESTYSFDATKIDGILNLEITHVNLLITIKKI